MTIDEGDRLRAIAIPILTAQPQPPRIVQIQELVSVDLAKGMSGGVVVLLAVGIALLPLQPSARSAAVVLAILAIGGFGFLLLFDLHQKAEALRRGVVATGRILSVSPGSRSGPIISLRVSMGSVLVDAPRQPWSFSSPPGVGQSIELLADPVSGWPLLLLGPETRPQ
jgi:hypothetical protein